MPNRILKESICTSDNLDALGWQAEAFFYRLLVQCDDYGRMDARPAIVRAKCFPLRLDHDECSEQATVEMLADLERCKLIYLYEVDDRPYLQVTTWENHQQIRAKRSKYPQPPSQENILQASDSTCNHVQANVPVIQSNPNPNPNPIQNAAAAGDPPPREQYITAGLAHFSNSIHMIANQIMRDEIVDRLGELYDRGITDWWELAIKRAIDANSRRWVYVRATIDRCMTDGRAPGIPAPDQGRSKGNGRPAAAGYGIADPANRAKQSRKPTQAEIDEFERLTAEQLGKAAATGRADMPGV